VSEEVASDAKRSSTELLDAVVQQIVEAVKPLRIVLFGSAARGAMGPDSDLDVLVVMPEGVHTRRIAQFLHQSLRNVGRPVDVLVATPALLERHKDNIGLIYKTILDEGKVIYARAES
jgi:predicted nucleotidyltransferase